MLHCTSNVRLIRSSTHSKLFTSHSKVVLLTLKLASLFLIVSPLVFLNMGHHLCSGLDQVLAIPLESV